MKILGDISQFSSAIENKVYKEFTYLIDRSLNKIINDTEKQTNRLIKTIAERLVKGKDWDKELSIYFQSIYNRNLNNLWQLGLQLGINHATEEIEAKFHSNYDLVEFAEKDSKKDSKKPDTFVARVTIKKEDTRDREVLQSSLNKDSVGRAYLERRVRTIETNLTEKQLEDIRQSVQQYLTNYSKEYKRRDELAEGTEKIRDILAYDQALRNTKQDDAFLDTTLKREERRRVKNPEGSEGLSYSIDESKLVDRVIDPSFIGKSIYGIRLNDIERKDSRYQSVLSNQAVANLEKDLKAALGGEDDLSALTRKIRSVEEQTRRNIDKEFFSIPEGEDTRETITDYVQSYLSSLRRSGVTTLDEKTREKLKRFSYNKKKPNDSFIDKMWSEINTDIVDVDNLQEITGLKFTNKEKQLLNNLSGNKGIDFGLLKTTEGSFVNKSTLKRIISTELTAAYNFGRLEAYHTRGIRYVQWTYENEHIVRGVVCELCRQRGTSGYGGRGIYTIMEAITQLDLMMPIHPNCLCYWKPVADNWDEANLVSVFGLTTTAAASIAGLLVNRRQDRQERILQEEVGKIETEKDSKVMKFILGSGSAALAIAGLYKIFSAIYGGKRGLTAVRLLQSPEIIKEVVKNDIQNRVPLGVEKTNEEITKEIKEVSEEIDKAIQDNNFLLQDKKVLEELRKKDVDIYETIKASNATEKRVYDTARNILKELEATIFQSLDSLLEQWIKTTIDSRSYIYKHLELTNVPDLKRSTLFIEELKKGLESEDYDVRGKALDSLYNATEKISNVIQELTYLKKKDFLEWLSKDLTDKEFITLKGKIEKQLKERYESLDLEDININTYLADTFIEFVLSSPKYRKVPTEVKNIVRSFTPAVEEKVVDRLVSAINGIQQDMSSYKKVLSTLEALKIEEMKKGNIDNSLLGLSAKKLYTKLDLSTLNLDSEIRIRELILNVRTILRRLKSRLPNTEEALYIRYSLERMGEYRTPIDNYIKARKNNHNLIKQYKASNVSLEDDVLEIFREYEEEYSRLTRLKKDIDDVYKEVEVINKKQIPYTSYTDKYVNKSISNNSAIYIRTKYLDTIDDFIKNKDNVPSREIKKLVELLNINKLYSGDFQSFMGMNTPKQKGLIKELKNRLQTEVQDISLGNYHLVDNAVTPPKEIIEEIKEEIDVNKAGNGLLDKKVSLNKTETKQLQKLPKEIEKLKEEIKELKRNRQLMIDGDLEDKDIFINQLNININRRTRTLIENKVKLEVYGYRNTTKEEIDNLVKWIEDNTPPKTSELAQERLKKRRRLDQIIKYQRLTKEQIELITLKEYLNRVADFYPQGEIDRIISDVREIQETTALKERDIIAYIKQRINNISG